MTKENQSLFTLFSMAYLIPRYFLLSQISSWTSIFSLLVPSLRFSFITNSWLIFHRFMEHTSNVVDFKHSRPINVGHFYSVQLLCSCWPPLPLIPLLPNGKSIRWHGSTQKVKDVAWISGDQQLLASKPHLSRALLFLLWCEIGPWQLPPWRQRGGLMEAGGKGHEGA